MKQIPLSLTGAAALAVLLAAPAVSSSAALEAQTTAAPAPQSTAMPVPAELKLLFEGITLTEVQTKQVIGIHRKYPEAGTAQPDSAKPGMGAGATDRRAEEAKELRTILTPDQQKVYDKNLALVKATWKKPGY